MDIYRFFGPDTTTHARTKAYLMSLLSYYVYNFYDKEGTKRLIPGNGSLSARFTELFQELSEDDPFEVDMRTGGSTEYAILSNERMVLVVFRGTDDDPEENEWFKPGKISNFNFRLYNTPNSWDKVRVHEGYYKTLAGVYSGSDGVRAVVRDKRSPGNKPVFLTGHSRGGALASLCAYRFQKVGGVPVAGVYTFGAPRVGNETFAKAYDDIGLWDKTFRWFRGRDLIPQFPDYDKNGAKSSYTRYRHAGQLYYINTSGRVKENASNHDYNPGNVPLSTSLAHHKMEQYARRMFDRVSQRQRVSPNNPSWLTKHDLSGWLPVMPG